MSVSSNILERIGTMTDADLNSLDREVAEKEAELQRLVAIRNAAYIAQMDIVQDSTQNGVQSSAQKRVNKTNSNVSTESTNNNEDAVGSPKAARARRETLVRYINEHGPQRPTKLLTLCGIPTGSCGFMFTHPWFDRESGDNLVHLTPLAHTEVLGKGDDE